MTEGLKQQWIEGTYDPLDRAVQEAAEEYVRLLTSRMRLQESENVARQTLLDIMRDRELIECEVSGYKVTRTHQETEKIKIKKLEGGEHVVHDADPEAA